MIGWKLVGRTIGPRYVGPYFLPTAANTGKAGRDLETLRPWFERGELKTHVLKSFALKEVPLAVNELKAQGGHDGSQPSARAAAGSFNGKLAITVAPVSLW